MREYIVRVDNNKFTIEGEIFRCKECRNRYTQQRCAGRHPNWFCAAGAKQITGKLESAENATSEGDGSTTGQPKSKLESEKLQLSPETSTNSEETTTTSKTETVDATLKDLKKPNKNCEVADDDLISRQAAINAVKKWFVEEYNSMPYEYDEEVKDNVFTDMKWVNISLEHNKEIRKVLKSLPPVEPKIVQPKEVTPHRNYKHLSDYWCECGWHLGKKGEVKYCAECGRKVNWDE